MRETTRRQLFRDAALGIAAAGLASPRLSGAPPERPRAAGVIQTVTGPIDPRDLGPCLTHEHILVDFIGADKIAPGRYDPGEVFTVMLPYLKDLKAAGIDALVECTPNYLGRDPELLVRLSRASGVKLLTNTGLYKDPFLPAWAREAAPEAIAERWIEEAMRGIGPNGIKPGFIKIAVNPGELIPVQQKIVRAAALASKATGLPIASHTNHAAAARQALDTLDEIGVPLSSYIIVHADSIPDRNDRFASAKRGAWLSYDGIREENAAAKVELVLDALARYPDQLLISQDAGWYHVGEPRGGSIAPFDYLPRRFVPALKQAGITDEAIDLLLVRNPRRAFAVRAASASETPTASQSSPSR